MLEVLPTPFRHLRNERGVKCLYEGERTHRASNSEERNMFAIWVQQNGRYTQIGCANMPMKYALGFVEAHEVLTRCESHNGVTSCKAPDEVGKRRRRASGNCAKRRWYAGHHARRLITREMQTEVRSKVGISDSACAEQVVCGVGPASRQSSANCDLARSVTPQVTLFA